MVGLDGHLGLDAVEAQDVETRPGHRGQDDREAQAQDRRDLPRAFHDSLRPNMYPVPRTVTMTTGSSGSSRSFSRRRAMCMSMVRVAMPRGSRRQTRVRISSREMARPALAARYFRSADLAVGQFLARAVAEPDLAARQVGHAAGHLDPRDAVGPLGAAAQHGVDPGQEFLDAERFDDVVVGPQAQALDAVLLLAAGGHDDDRQRGPVLPHGLQDLQAVGAGHDQVQQDEVAGGLAGQDHPLVPVGRLQGRVARELQGIDDPLPDGGIVFDDQDFALVHGSPLRWRDRSPIIVPGPP